MTTQVPVRFTYQKDGTVPPVYVAGTFSDPAWQPFEMDVSQTEDGQNVFSKVIDVSDASDIQYKFRIGSENWWLCNETAETVTDDQGNMNNILRVPSRQPDKTSDTPDEVDRDDSSPPPLSPTGAASEIDPEDPNTAGKLNIDNSAPDSSGVSGQTEPLNPSCPMFSHEHVAYPDEDDTFDDPSEDPQGPLDDYQLRKQSETTQHEYAQDPDIDLDDPTLEKFPSDSASIMATIRRLSTSVNEDRTFPQGRAPSLVVNPFQSSTDDLPDAQSLAVPPADQPRTDGKKSSLSVSAGSVSSLNSIAESDDEPTNDEQEDTPLEGFTPVIQHPAAIRAQPGVADSKRDAQGDGPGSEDEGIAMCNVARQRPAEGNLDGTNSLIPEPVDFTHRPPSHIVEPILHSSTPIPEADRIDSAEISANGLAVNHVRAVSPHIVISSPSTDSSNGNNQNIPRKSNADRPISRTSMNSIQDVKGGANWLQVFIHMLLVDWVGGFLSRLWHGGRTA